MQQSWHFQLISIPSLFALALHKIVMFYGNLRLDGEMLV